MTWCRTGCSGRGVGAGYETARSLALHGAHVTLACRDLRSAAAAVGAITRERPTADVRAMHVDLAHLRTVRQFARDYLALNMCVAVYCYSILFFWGVFIIVLLCCFKQILI